MSPEIMLVDDERIICDIYGSHLTDLGYNVSAFYSGEDAIRSFIENPSRFIFAILDFMMPGLNGEQLARALRGHNSPENYGKKLPIGIASCVVSNMSQEEKSRLLEVADMVVDKLDIIGFEAFQSFVNKLSQIRVGNLENTLNNSNDTSIALG